MDSFICNLTLDGICYTFGVFLVPLMDYFQVEEKGPISLIGDTITCILHIVYLYLLQLLDFQLFTCSV